VRLRGSAAGRVRPLPEPQVPQPGPPEPVAPQPLLPEAQQLVEVSWESCLVTRSELWVQLELGFSGRILVLTRREWG